MEPRDQNMLALEGKRILVAEDNEIFQRAVQQELVAAGATVVLVGNGADAVERLRDNQPFDLVLMDMDMPMMGGLEATRRIRQEERGRHVLIVAMTSNVSYDDQRRCREAGMDDFQPKPMPPAAFYAHLANVLAGRLSRVPAVAGSLFEQLGPDKLHALVDAMYRRILGDPRLAPFFAAMPMNRQRQRMQEFLTVALGGPSEKRHADMRQAHTRPRAAGMTDLHFDAVAGHLADELRAMAIPEPTIAEVMTLLGSLRRDVLGR